MTQRISFNVPAPPGSAQWVSSDDPDEVTALVSPRDGDHSRVVHGKGPYGFRLARIESTAVQVAWARTRLANTLRARFRTPTFHLPLDGGQLYSFGRRRFEAAAGHLVFMAPGTDVTRCSNGASIVAIDLDEAAFESEVHRLEGADGVSRPCVPLLVELAEPQKGELIESIAALVHAHRAGGPDVERLHAASRLLSTLAGTLTRSTASHCKGVSPGRIRDVEDWIDAHLGEAITLGRLCEVAKVGERSLQLAFQAQRGMSPLRFVCERRLAEVQRRLISSTPCDDVTGVATSLGFTHLGRFASAYRRAFGESPSQTLSRGRATAGAPALFLSSSP